MENSVNLAFVSFEKLVIPFSSLEKGISAFEFKTVYPSLQGEQGCRFPHEIEVKAQVTSLGDDFLVEINVRSKGEFICDRCGEEFQKEIEGGVKTLYTSEDMETIREEWDDVKVLLPGGEGIDISQDAWDGMLLAVPSKHLCKEDCLGLCGDCGKNLNIEDCHCSRNNTDPRWDVLKDFKSENE